MPISKLTNRKEYGWQRSGNFSNNRSKIDKIVLHHNAGTGSGVVPNCWLTRQASAHYQIENGQIIACLDESLVAWHCGAKGYSNNEHTIGIEHQNSTGDPTWKVSRTNEELSAKLVADIASRYNIPIDRAHVVKHKEMPGCATVCSGGLDIDWIVKRAKELSKNSSDNVSDETSNTNTTNKTQGDYVMKIIKLTSDGDYYGKKYKKGACFAMLNDGTLRYIERKQTLDILNKDFGYQTVTQSGGGLLHIIQDLGLSIK